MMPQFRFSIDRLMILVAVAAGIVWLYRSVNVFAFFTFICYAALVIGQAVVYSLWFRRVLRPSWWSFSTLALVLLLVFGVLGVTFVGMFPSILKILLAFVLMPILLALGIARIRESGLPEGGRKRRQYLAWMVVSGVVVVPLSMVFIDWPMQWEFQVSRPAFERLADRIEAGGTPAWPVRAGLFWVGGFGRGHEGSGNIALQIGADSGGNTWFVRSAKPSDPLLIPPQVFISEKLTADGRWWHQEED